MNEQYEALKKAIQEANPSIMDLEFGCEVRGYIPAYGELYEGTDYHEAFEDTGVITNSEYLQIHSSFGDILIEDLKKDLDYYLEEDGFEFEILGRPIRLADVLLAVGKDETDLPNGCACNLCHIPKWKIIHSDITGSSIGWDLKDDNLDNQSDETKVFLINLLCREQK